MKIAVIGAGEIGDGMRERRALRCDRPGRADVVHGAVVSRYFAAPAADAEDVRIEAQALRGHRVGAHIGLVSADSVQHVFAGDKCNWRRAAHRWPR